MNDDTPVCERHEANYIQSEGYQNRNSHYLYSHQSHHDLDDFEKSLTELNNDVKNNLEDFKRCIRSMRTDYDKLYEKEPKPKTDLQKSITKLSDSQRVTSMFFKTNVNVMILKTKQNKKNFQTKYKDMERKMDEWEKSHNVSSEQTERTDPSPPQAHTEHVNAVFTGSVTFDDSPKIQKDPPPPIIVNNKIKKIDQLRHRKGTITWSKQKNIHSPTDPPPSRGLLPPEAELTRPTTNRSTAALLPSSLESSVFARIFTTTRYLHYKRLY
nr:hypothetical protein [Tanacetum cinerariifolium]